MRLIFSGSHPFGHFTVVYTGFRGWGRGSREQWSGVLFYIGEIENFVFFILEKFQKMLKNQ